MLYNVSISKTFTKLCDSCAFIPFITAGDPDLSITKKAIHILAEEGADMIELGIPYSDPLADGPTIQAASLRALQNGITFNAILDLVKDVTNTVNTPLIAFTYYNLIINQGIENFVSKIKLAGFKGLLVPDLPLEEIDFLEKKCQEYRIELVLLISPNSSVSRIKKIVQKAHGCLYLVSSTGVTGMKFGPNAHLQNVIKQIKNLTKQALIVGFGISTQENINIVKSWGVNGIVMGSSFVNKLYTCSNEEELLSFREYCKQIKKYIN